MTRHTLAAYLDCIDDKGKIRRQFSWWRRRDGFPEPDPHSKMYYKPEIDRFLDAYFGLEDPVTAATRELDRRFGC